MRAAADENVFSVLTSPKFPCLIPFFFIKLALLVTLECYAIAESLRSHSFGRRERGLSRSSRRIMRARYLLINSFAVFPLGSIL